MFKLVLLLTLLSPSLFGAYYYNQGEKKVLTKLVTTPPLATLPKTEKNYYRTSAGNRVGVDDTLIVAFKDLKTQLYIEKSYSLTMLEKLTSHMFLYQVKDKKMTLEMANTLSKLPSIKFAQPNFSMQKHVRTKDPLYDDTWHLDDYRGGANIKEAWQAGAYGQGVIVGVYDEGIDITHEDLRGNIIGFGNYSQFGEHQIDMINANTGISNRLQNAPEPAPKPKYNATLKKYQTVYIWHGTSCAGLIAAIGNNYRGSVGVAPKSKLLALRFGGNISEDIKAYRDMEKAGVAIITNSWGTNDMNDALNEVFSELSYYGRGGKGVLIFFAAGNSGCNMDEYFVQTNQGENICLSLSQYQRYRGEDIHGPINDESESPYVISIAASGRYNRIANYSNYGSSIDFTAPGSGLITTDAMGARGATSNNYTYNFTGTSAAAPVAAGIAALVLSANPDLSKEEVIDIFKITSKKLGRYNYDNGGMGRNDHWGYGRLDAGAAVRLAKTYGKTSRLQNFMHKIYVNMH